MSLTWQFGRQHRVVQKEIALLCLHATSAQAHHTRGFTWFCRGETGAARALEKQGESQKRGKAVGCVRGVLRAHRSA